MRAAPLWSCRTSELDSPAEAVLLAGLLSTLAFSFARGIFLVCSLAAFCMLRRTAHRVVALTISGGVFLGLPWLMVAGFSGCVWCFSVRPFTGYSPNLDRLFHSARGGFLSLRVAVISISIGVAAGGVAAGASFDHIRASPLVLEFPPPSLEQVIPAVFLLAAVNSIGEELVWRGMLYRHVENSVPLLQMPLQVVSFGLAHFSGIPGGVSGCVLAGTFAALATIARRSFGLAACIAIHLGADLVIFAVVFANADYSYVTVM